MIRPGCLASADRLELQTCVRSQRDDHGIARRANATLLLDDPDIPAHGESCAQIARFLYLDDDIIRGWYKSDRESGWEALGVDGWAWIAGRGWLGVDGWAWMAGRGWLGVGMAGKRVSHLWALIKKLPYARGWKAASAARRPRSDITSPLKRNQKA